MFNHKERVAFVTQIVHHAHEPANIARMQANAWLVHHEQRIDE